MDCLEMEGRDVDCLGCIIDFLDTLGLGSFDIAPMVIISFNEKLECFHDIENHCE